MTARGVSHCSSKLTIRQQGGDPDGKGAGIVLLRHLAAFAYRTGVRRWRGVMLATNERVKRAIDHGERGITLPDLFEAVREEFKENEDLPNTTNPDDWARISGRKGERIINVRTLMTGINRNERSIENITSGQYL